MHTHSAANQFVSHSCICKYLTLYSCKAIGWETGGAAAPLAPPYLHPYTVPTMSSSCLYHYTHIIMHITVSQISSFIAVTKKYTSSVDMNTCTGWSSAVGLCYSLQLILLLDGIGVGRALRKRNRRDQNQLVLYTSKSWVEFHRHLNSGKTISGLP